MEPRGDGGEVEGEAFIFKFTTARLIFKAVSILVRQLGRLGEISSDLYRLLQCDIEICRFDSLKVKQNR